MTKKPKERVNATPEFDEDFEAAVTDAGLDFKLFARYSAVKQRVFRVVYHSYAEVMIFVLILISVGMLVYDTATTLSVEAKRIFDNIEDGLTCFFVVEYVVKFWLAPKKLRFVIRNWIDLLALIPFLRVFRLGRGLRLLRLFRLLRLIRVGSLVQSKLSTMKTGIEQRLIDNMIVLGFMAFAVVFGTVGIMVFEADQPNTGYQSIGDALWWCIVTVTTVGYGDISPTTAGGRVVACIIMFIGLSFYAFLTGLVTNGLIDRFRREEGKGMDVAGLKGHTVICGWDDHGVTIIQELLNYNIYMHVVVITERERIPISEANVHVIQGDFTQREILEKARVAEAKSAIVLADRTGNRSQQDADARSILGVLAIESYNSDVYTTAEVLNPDNEFHFTNAGVDEIIVSGAYTGNLLAHATISAGLGGVYNDLLTMEGNRLHMVPAPTTFVNLEFMEALNRVARKDALLIGYRREGETLLNPMKEKLEAGDTLIMLSDHRPKLD